MRAVAPVLKRLIFFLLLPLAVAAYFLSWVCVGDRAPDVPNMLADILGI